MERIYTGDEPMLVDLLIERAILEKSIDVVEIKEILIECSMPNNNELNLWHIVITIKADYTYKSDFYSKKCIKHSYSRTYLQHLRNMGIKKLKLNKLNNRGK